MILSLYVIGSLLAIIFLSAKLRQANAVIRQMKAVMPSLILAVPTDELTDILTGPEQSQNTGGQD